MTLLPYNHGLKVPWEMSSLNPESRITWKVPKHNIKSLLKKKKLLLLYPLSPHLLQPFEYLPINKILSSIYIHTGIPQGSHNTPQIPSQISFKWNGPDETMHSVFGPTLCRNSVFLPESKYTVFVISSWDSCAIFHIAVFLRRAHRPDQIWFSYRVAQEEFALTHLKITSVTESSFLY